MSLRDCTVCRVVCGICASIMKLNHLVLPFIPSIIHSQSSNASYPLHTTGYRCAILLGGPGGSGKSALVREAARLVGLGEHKGDELMEIHLDDQVCVV